MLSRIPGQTRVDIEERIKREPMTRTDKRRLMRGYGLGIFCLVVINAILTMCRDFRDDFMVEIAHEIGIDGSMNIFSRIELGIGLFVLLVVGSLSFIRSNKKSFSAMHFIILAGLAILFGGSWAYSVGMLSPLVWFISVGCGIFLAYIVIQSVYFDRFIALFKPKANAGFLIYKSDSAGYVGTILVLCYKQFFASAISWSRCLAYLGIGVAGIGLIALCIGGIFFFVQSQKRDFRILYMNRLRRIINNKPQESFLHKQQYNENKPITSLFITYPRSTHYNR
jgi:hypothetical protein